MQTSSRFPAAGAEIERRKRTEYLKPWVIEGHAYKIARLLLEDPRYKGNVFFREIDAVLTEGNPADLLGYEVAKQLGYLLHRDILCVSGESQDIVGRNLTIRHNNAPLVVGKKVLIVDVTVHPRLILLSQMSKKIPFHLVGVATIMKGTFPLVATDCGVQEIIIVEAESKAEEWGSTSVEMPNPLKAENK